jgi:hypothetical protein
MPLEATGIEGVRARLAELEARLSDLSPVLKVVAQEVELRTDNAFATQTSPSGEVWDALSDATLVSRMRRQKGLSRKDSRGRLTQGAKKKRATAFLSTKGFAVGKAPFAVALTDTARARRSVRARVVGDHIEFSAVGYLGPHITGASGAGRSKTVSIPKRNPTVFELRSGAWFLNASMAEYLHNAVRRYVTTGAV